jgi:hypothetical protein
MCVNILTSTSTFPYPDDVECHNTILYCWGWVVTNKAVITITIERVDTITIDRVNLLLPMRHYCYY